MSLLGFDRSRFLELLKKILDAIEMSEATFKFTHYRLNRCGRIEVHL